MKVIRIKEDVFSTKVQIFVCSMKKFNELAERNGFAPEGDEDTTGTHQVHYKGGSSTHIIWIKGEASKEEKIDILAHEMIHLVMKRFKNLQVPIGPKNEETFAYFYASMFTKALYKLGLAKK